MKRSTKEWLDKGEEDRTGGPLAAGNEPGFMTSFAFFGNNARRST